jgi:hypothetical protein
LRRFFGRSFDINGAAHIHHRYTNYDELLMKGYERREARKMVEEKVLNVLWKWEGKK